MLTCYNSTDVDIDEYITQPISVRTVFMWVEAFKAGNFSIKDDTFTYPFHLCLFSRWPDARPDARQLRGYHKI